MKENKDNEIRRLENIIIFVFSFLLILTILIIGLTVTFNDKLKDVPHKVCHNETELKPFYRELLALGERGITLSVDEKMRLKCNKDCVNDNLIYEQNDFYYIYQKCLYECIKKEAYIIREVCEIK